MIFTDSWFTYKGRRSSDYDILVEKQPAIISPAKRGNTFTVPGRNGTLHTTDGAYENYTKPAECAILSARYIDEISAWLKGDGDVIFSNEPNRKYEATIVNSILFAKVFGMGFKRFLVQFDVQPFKCEINQRAIPPLTKPGLINNIGTVYAEPIITIYAQGDLTVTINGRSFSLSGIMDYITIDSRMVCAYRKPTGTAQGMELMNHHMSGEFPYFDVGKNDISWAAAPSGRVDRLEVTPYWRWL